MKIKLASLAIVVITLLMLGACSNPAPVDTQATIDAAVQGTQQAGKNAQATIEMAVQATVTQVESANQSTIATAVQATLTAQPTPDYDTLSEEEFAALIDEAVNEALAEAEDASTATTQATSDGAISSDEVATTTDAIYQSYYAVAYAEELIAAYYEYYGAYADAALATLNEMEDDLQSISQSLDEISAIMAQGAETASTAIDQLNAAVDNIETKTTETQAKIQGWSEEIKTSLGQRENEILNLVPNQVEPDKISALTQTHDFLEAFKSALTDGKFSPAELSAIGQLSANARASLLSTGDQELAKLTEGIEMLTRNAARGEWNKARNGVGNFEHSLPERPGRRR